MFQWLHCNPTEKLSGSLLRVSSLEFHCVSRFLCYSYLFWTDWGTSPFIARMGLDGTNIVKIITNSVYWPNGITVDYESDRIFWVDAYLVRVE